jgi:hypothetical protein
MKVNAWYACVNYVCGGIEHHSIQISDDGDHVGTVQYNFTESSCIAVSNLSSGIKYNKHLSNRCLRTL